MRLAASPPTPQICCAGATARGAPGPSYPGRWRGSGGRAPQGTGPWSLRQVAGGHPAHWRRHLGRAQGSPPPVPPAPQRSRARAVRPGCACAAPRSADPHATGPFSKWEGAMRLAGIPPSPIGSLRRDSGPRCARVGMPYPGAGQWGQSPTGPWLPSRIGTCILRCTCCDMGRAITKGFASKSLKRSLLDWNRF
jgi:hypothetical protein